MPGTEKKTSKLHNQNRETQNDAENVAESFRQAGKDIKKDPDLAQKPDPSEDLDQ